MYKYEIFLYLIFYLLSSLGREGSQGLVSRDTVVAT